MKTILYWCFSSETLVSTMDWCQPLNSLTVTPLEAVKPSGDRSPNDTRSMSVEILVVASVGSVGLALKLVYTQPSTGEPVVTSEGSISAAGTASSAARAILASSLLDAIYPSFGWYVFSRYSAYQRGDRAR